MSKLGFVILHYMTYEDTVNCVTSILEKIDEAPIVIVDNGSTNETGAMLKNKYRDNHNITVLCLNQNLGFAKGNNKGIQYLRNNSIVDFIVVLNNDTLILQDDFEKKVIDEYNNSQFACLGPKIITKDNNEKTNPVEVCVETTKEVIILLLKRIIKLLICYLHLDFMIHTVGQSVKYLGKYDNNQRYENVKLHGACWIFSKEFFLKNKGLNESTFLYFEEDILYIELKRAGLLSVYNPEIVILHLEDSSTNSISKNSHQKNIFVLRNEVISLMALLKVLRR